MAQEAKKLKWHTFEDLEFMKQRVTHIQGLRSFTNPHKHGVEIFSRMEERHPNMRGSLAIRHYLAIHMNAYGETVYERDFPFHTHIRDVKKAAEIMLTKLQSEGYEIIPD